jgi:hypothetical protein
MPHPRPTEPVGYALTLELDFTWWNSRFRGKTERGGSQLHFYSSTASCSNRSSRLIRQGSVAAKSGSVTNKMKKTRPTGGVQWSAKQEGRGRGCWIGQLGHASAGPAHPATTRNEPDNPGLGSVRRPKTEK